jgi:hypothetical protein
MYFCIVLIINVLVAVWQEKCGKKRIGGVGVQAILGWFFAQNRSQNKSWQGLRLPGNVRRL